MPRPGRLVLYVIQLQRLINLIAMLKEGGRVIPTIFLARYPLNNIPRTTPPKTSKRFDSATLQLAVGATPSYRVLPIDMTGGSDISLAGTPSVAELTKPLPVQVHLRS